MKEQTNYDYEKYVQIAQMAKMGWWESDLKNKEYICSDFIVDLLGLESNRISFTEFHQRIREDHRLRLKNEYMSLSYLETYEQMFPIRAKDGEIWVYSKINFQKPDKEGYRNMTGFLQYIDRPIDTTNENIDFFQVSNLLYQQTNISYSLLAFLQCDDVTQVVNKTLGDLLNQFLGDRIYIFEINRKEQRQDCTYEVTAEGISKSKNHSDPCTVRNIEGTGILEQYSLGPFYLVEPSDSRKKSYHSEHVGRHARRSCGISSDIGNAGYQIADGSSANL